MAKSTKSKQTAPAAGDERALVAAYARAIAPGTVAVSEAWAGIEPTFSNKKAVRKWRRLSAKEGGEDAFFEDGYMVRTQRAIAREIRKRYRAARKDDDGACLFADVEHERGTDQWDVERQELAFTWRDRDAQPFEVRFGLDPETFEYSIKPVPIVWFYEPGFVRFLQQFLWDVPREFGLMPSIAHGGGQFSLSAKTFLQGSLLADDIATRLDHPELATWIMDFPNPDDRAFRATNERRAAFENVLADYWAGGFHPRAIGTLTFADAFHDRGFAAQTARATRELMDPKRGPVGSPSEIFRTNFAFGRTVRLDAQSVHPGYWQSAHPHEDGYRPDQIMRYSEGNLNRLKVPGELHVKSGKVLDEERVPAFDAPLEPALLYSEASWEMRAQMSRVDAHDFVDALLLDVHYALWLQEHPHVSARSSLVQDQILGDAERTLARHAPKVLAKLHAQARKENLDASGGRVKSDWIEPETLFWAAWEHLPRGEQTAIAREAVAGFVERVERAASKDPRPDAARDPMERHRHRVHPLLWGALEGERDALASSDPVRRELQAWSDNRKRHLARRPRWSVAGGRAPWE